MQIEGKTLDDKIQFIHENIMEVAFHYDRQTLVNEIGTTVNTFCYRFRQISPMPYHTFRKAAINKFVLENHKKLSPDEIAKALKMTTSNAKKLLKKLGVKPKLKMKRWTEEEDDQIIRFFQKNDTSTLNLNAMGELFLAKNKTNRSKMAVVYRIKALRDYF